ncbi:hypothetical protein SEA_SAVAGE2526_13 [Arthrobacter phage Savage2526]|uniref:Uncharacterized protein n=20 Tax=Korravirus TaxID=1982076 RepID=A0A3S9U9P2_9CAUD|nr:neck protein [Arthrobacter phage Glenn]YP_009602756.1 neck protein [Arthrobacter phage Korra]YP_010050549.1 neck protein [Arthrobacter phage Wawa]ALY09223.1 hypothetical protein IMMACULATA_13 [Arthrobacter phage Immaculata]ALY10032.1 hypothetical protein RAP15_13 [Arthrobacter phage RAP15]AOT24103.1 hypothetical protein SEA_VALLEJO_13 [Arthrobacter phage Vallejo]ASR83458.1 hypothetical protein SEA_DINO_13 [Arthrobacter phage Dino]ATW58887.1 hypothetical protein PHIRE_FLUKE_13 [Arthrobacte
MAEEVKVVLNDAGIKALMNSPEVQAHLLQAANRMAFAARGRAGGDAIFDATVQPGKTRARASVITANKSAQEAEAQDRALSSSIDALRG